MFIAIPKCLKAKVADVSSVSFHLQAAIMKTGYRNMLILNTYFPQYPKTDDFETDDLLITLIGIQNILKENDCTEVIWTGDINADFSRDTKFVDIIENFVNEQNLGRFWDRFDVDYTHASNVRDITYVGNRPFLLESLSELKYPNFWSSTPTQLSFRSFTDILCYIK